MKGNTRINCKKVIPFLIVNQENEGSYTELNVNPSDLRWLETEPAKTFENLRWF